MTDTREAIEPAHPRMLPQLTEANRAFWTGGAEGRLLVPRCRDCRRWTLPPSGSCPACGGPTISEAASGRARVLTWTVNSHQFHPDIPAPNLIAIVTLDEQQDLRLATNLIACEPGEIRAGMPVEVRFEHHGEIYYPLFTPAAEQ